MELYKTTIVIWTQYDPASVELADLAQDATDGDAYCSHSQTERIADPEADPMWDGTEFFDCPGENRQEERCRHCHAAIHQDDHGSWVDETDGDGCDPDVHEPA